MDKTLQKMKWYVHNYKYKRLLIWGIKHQKISLYSEEIIEKLRTIYNGGIPASIILLSEGLSNGYCYDRALLMAKAFLDEEDDVNLIYASVDSIKLNPRFIRDDPMYADHCVVEIITKDDKHFIIDTSAGLIFDKNIYWLMENPKIRKINNKEAITKYVKFEEEYEPEDIERDKYASPLILPMIESTYGRPNEIYSMLGIELLQKEIEKYKELIDYNGVCKEIDDDMRRLGLRK